MPKSYPVVDADIHVSLNGDRIAEFLPEPWRTRWRGGNRSPGYIGYWNPNGVSRSDTVLEDGTRIESSPAALLEHHLDRYGIDYGILNVVPAQGLAPNPDWGAAVCAAHNDVLANDWFPVSDRILGSINVAPTDPELAAEEIHRHADTPGFVQVLMPSGAQMLYGNRYYLPIYEAAAAHNLPVAIHPGTEGTGISGAPTASGYPTNYFEWHTGLVGNYIAHLASVISEGIFVRFPNLKFVLQEGGVGWVPPFFWRFDKNWKALRLVSPWLERPPSEYAAEHIRLTTQPQEEPDNREHFAQIVRMFPSEKMLMFSTDFPHWDGDTPQFAAKWFPEALRGRVMGGNAMDLYNLKLREPANA